MKTVKATGIVEEAVLNYVKNDLVTDSSMQELVVEANKSIALEAAKVRPDVAPLKLNKEQLERGNAKLLDAIQSDELPDGLALIKERIRQNTQEIHGLAARILAAETPVALLPPVWLEDVLRYMKNLRTLLDGHTRVVV
jgi:hypothetical protein